MDMSRYEYRKLVDDVADAVVAKIAKLHQLANDKPQYVTLKEAATIVRRSVAWMRLHKNEFPHKKLGDGAKQGQLLFLEDALYKFLQ
jgi:hypothetical protein